MSYRITLMHERCAHCGVLPETDDWDCTSNLAPMWRRAGCDLLGFKGKRASECAAVLREGIAALEREPDVYRAMNPPNGFGSYEELLPALRRLLALLDNHQNAIVQVRR
jgi:hypothetical protein